MKVIKGSQKLKNLDLKNSVITIGNFDGLHIGHQLIIKNTIQRAKTIKGVSIVYTFEPHPLAILAPHKAPLIITSLAEKISLLEDTGLDLLVCETFTKQFARNTPEQFIRNILYPRFHPREILVGHDYAFGKDREGSIRLLKTMGKELGYTVWEMRDITINDIPLRSTTIRYFISTGQVYEAARLLGRPYRLPGTVIKGQQRGIGVATANLNPDKNLIPKNGIYVIEAETPFGTFGGVVNIGVCPTFGVHERTIEAHLFDFDRTLYGKKIALLFIERLREEKKFKNSRQLAAQIEKDVKQAKLFLQQQK